MKYIQGPGNDFYLGGARIIKKMKFCPFWKFLLYKTQILGGARAPPAPPVPRCLPIFIAENSNSMDSKLVKGDSGSPVWYFDEENQEFYQVGLLMLI